MIHCCPLGDKLMFLYACALSVFHDLPEMGRVCVTDRHGKGAVWRRCHAATTRPPWSPSPPPRRPPCQVGQGVIASSASLVPPARQVPCWQPGTPLSFGRVLEGQPLLCTTSLHHRPLATDLQLLAALPATESSPGHRIQCSFS